MSKTNKKSKTKLESVSVSSYEELPSSQSTSTKPSNLKRTVVFALIGVAAIFLGYKYKHLVVAANANGRLITTVELNRLLQERYGEQTLNNLVTQALVEQEIKTSKIVIENTKIDEKIEEVKKSLPAGMSLEDALKYQNTDIEELKHQIGLQLAIEELLKDKVSVTDTEIDKFIKENKSFLTATSSADQKAEARTALTKQKYDEVINTWVTDLQSKAKIVRYLNF